MPRIAHTVLHHAHSISPLLPPILRSTRDLSSARAELRWLTEELHQFPSRFLQNLTRLPYLPRPLQPVSRIRHRQPWKWTSRLAQLRLAADPAEKALRQCVDLRARHYPLQYILGTQPFHLLDMAVRPGVLIPRPETEELTVHLARLVEEHHRDDDDGGLRVADLCAGSGCIGLLLACLVKGTVAVGVDVSRTALGCMRENQRRCESDLAGVESMFHPVHHDVLAPASETAEFLRARFEGGKVDLIVSNPPYISHRGFNKDTARSVRLWEPKLALVPDGADENVFYERIIDVAGEVYAKGIVFEVGGWEQAGVVQELMERRGWKSAVWADFCGKGRTVVGFPEGGWSWLAIPPSKEGTW